MKIIAQLLLFLFVSFLITPTIVRLIEKDADISTFYSFSEDEKVQKEIIAIVNIDLISTSPDLSQLNNKLIFSENLSKLYTISAKIFIPPPKHV
jgi:hypothetical protein